MGYKLTKPLDITPKAGMVLVKFAVMLGANVDECCGFGRYHLRLGRQYNTTECIINLTTKPLFAISFITAT